MSREKREAFEAGCWWFDGVGSERKPNSSDIIAEANERYPDSPLGNVRECMVQLLKDSGYDGLCNCSFCWCVPGDSYFCSTCVNGSCRPGVLVDGKIVEREG